MAVAFARMPSSQNPLSKGRIGEDAMCAYYRCIVVCFASIRRWNPNVDLVLVSADSLPEPFCGQLDRLGVQIVLAHFGHRPPEGLGKWGGSLFLFDALEKLRGKGGLQIFIDPDVLCVRPLDDLVASLGEAVGVQGERLQDLQKPSSDKFKGYRQTCAEMYPELGEATLEHGMYGGHFYAVPERWTPLLLERIERAWKLSLVRFEQGRPTFSTEEPIMNYAVRAVPVMEMGSYVRSIPTAPWRRFLTDPDIIRGLTLWHLIHEKDMGFQRMYGCAADPLSWFWRSSPEEFRDKAGAMMSATHQTPQRALLNFCGDIIERVTSERAQNRLKPLYTQLVRISTLLRRP
ncbi:hypothetical protein [Kitasatospora atroaurantiaca]|uniref:Glycosyl transferase family 8 n=1 Tax=Kitasatospora atroaurantiaca TaxID=285545 RepID=A0A561EYU5_9ACTN|nr:hypothetical protein [Kitasatospora atroaurantiaca]TWE20783.1 hypothetical protein FB465_5941 [Kitasatospora atroaurantiaca]